MTRVGCTGHQTLTARTRRLVVAAVAGILVDLQDEPLVGYSSLADGADQLFALSVLAAGGQLRAIVPSHGYEKTFTSDTARRTFSLLLGLATETTTLPFAEPSEDAFLAAGHHVADHCDVLVAVWDGEPAAGKGGTADVVGYAQAHGVEVRIVWPLGAKRQNRGD